MALETLNCTECGEDWERERKRGRKPKVCPDCKDTPAPEPTVIRKSENPPADETLEGFGPQVIDIETGKRDESKVVELEIEIPDDARVQFGNSLPGWLAKYDHFIIEDVSYKRGDTVKIKNHEHRGCTFRVDYLTKNTNPELDTDYKIYVEMFGKSGFCMGKFRVSDPWRVEK